MNESNKKLEENNGEMPFSDHLEELRQRIINSIFATLICIVFSFLVIKPLIQFLEIPAKN